jgi:hypothetical protein
MECFAMCFAIVVGVVPALALAATPLVPAAGGPVTASSVLINGSSGDQNDPHVSGNLAAYTDTSSGAGQIRYYDFSTTVDTAIAMGASSYDFLSDVSGELIVFTRIFADRSAIMLFDTSTSALTEVDPRAGSSRLGAALGGGTVGFIDQSAGSGDLYSYNISTATVAAVSTNVASEQNPNVSPDGAAIVWELCPTGADCDVYKAIRSGDSWSVSAVANTTDVESNPDTDGTMIVYDVNVTGSTTGQDIYLVPQSGGAAMQLVLSGDQHNPSISSGVIGFESRSSSSSPRDLFIYVIATNTAYQVTNTSADEVLNDVTVLSNGSIRMVWAANDGATGDYNVHGATFTVPLSNPPPPIFSFTGFFEPVDDLPTFNSVKAGGAVPVKFSLGGDLGLNIFAPGYPASSQIACNAVAPVNAIEATVTSGGSSLSYDPSTGQYGIVWKTDKSWAGTCRQLTVKLADGSSHSANFAFTR